MAITFDLKAKPRLRHVPLDRIAPNPYQPRKVFDPAGLEELADSIRRYGVLTPLTVRREGEGYLLIAGERRLRASRMAGLETVPCYILTAEGEDLSAMALIENLQRRDLDPFEEAEGLLRLTRDFGLTQQQVAERIGKTQAAVANKLRLLKLPPPVVEIIRENGLTERHGRALLQLEDPDLQLKAAETVAAKGYTVAQTEEYVSRLLQTAPRPRRQSYIKDVRLFLNSVNKALELMKRSGFQTTLDREEQDGQLTLRIVLKGVMKQ